jgi:WhiB family redox-sensing transcriptional regulator
MSNQGRITQRYISLLQSIHQEGGVPCERVPALFFPEDLDTTELRAAATKAAKALCHSCPIINECFEFAVETDQRHGVWGGTSADER